MMKRLRIEDLLLLIFDVDGTIANKDSHRLTPEAEDFFELLYQYVAQGNQIQVALATNQGGVSVRCWMEQDKFGEPEAFPTVAMVQERLTNITAQIPLPVRVYVSYAYQNDRRQWAPVPLEYAGQPEWSRAWRKPQPGMIYQAMIDAQVSNPARVLVVGDQATDAEAAERAGARFRYTRQFYAEVEQFLGLEVALS
jgi:HAD superfamily hydrolase (TIGR01662 family)